MPSVKKYQSGHGYYIRSNIDGRFVTLQLSPEAEGLLSSLGFRDDENISWSFLQPLCEIGHAYTNKSGTEVETDAIDVETAATSGRLGPEDQDRLEEFLAEHTPGDNEDEDGASSDQSEHSGMNVEDIDEQRKGFIQSWSPTDEEYEATLNRIMRAGDGRGILKSIAHHGTEHPMSVARFRVSSQGVPTYSFESAGVPWTVHDYRTVRSGHTTAQLFINIQPGSKRAQSVTVESDGVEWHTLREEFTAEQIDEFLTVSPDILCYIRNLVRSPSIEPREIKEGATATLTEEDVARVHELTSVQPVDPDTYERVAGAVLTFGEKGYGRIRAHTGHTFPFNEGEVDGENIQPGDVVTLGVKQHRGMVYACDIHKVDFGLPSSEIVCRWPEWCDESLAWLREHWTDESEGSDTLADTIVLPRSDDEQEHKRISVSVDLLSFYVITNAEHTAEKVDTAIRIQLKDSIDGSIPAPRPTIATKTVELSMPRNLIVMIDSVIEVSTDYTERGQFISTAIQQHQESEEEIKTTIRMSKSYHDAAEQLAEEENMPTAEFMRSAIKNLIATEIKRKN